MMLKLERSSVELRARDLVLILLLASSATVPLTFIVIGLVHIL